MPGNYLVSMSISIDPVYKPGKNSSFGVTFGKFPGL
jgi:hypothetical protein